MPSPVRLTGKVEWPKIIWDSPAAKDREIRALDGQRFECVIEKEKKHCSDRQRRYYRGVICKMVAKAFEIDEDAAHRGLAQRFLTVTPEKGLPYVRSTESLTTVEKEEYHRQCRQFGDEWLHIYIPEPNETDEFMSLSFPVVPR